MVGSPLAVEVSFLPFPPVASTEIAQQGFYLLLCTHLPVMHVARLHRGLEVPQDAIALTRTLEMAEPVPSYMPYIPQRLGLNPALDSAVDCVFSAASYIAASFSHEQRQVLLSRKYTLALSYLREAIEDPILAMSAETLAAVALLGSYEVSRKARFPNCPFSHATA
jgi:hypothetical protein